MSWSVLTPGAHTLMVFGTETLRKISSMAVGLAAF
jgi:hypothetical protein